MITEVLTFLQKSTFILLIPFLTKINCLKFWAQYPLKLNFNLIFIVRCLFHVFLVITKSSMSKRLQMLGSFRFLTFACACTHTKVWKLLWLVILHSWATLFFFTTPKFCTLQKLLINSDFCMQVYAHCMHACACRILKLILLDSARKILLFAYKII